MLLSYKWETLDKKFLSGDTVEVHPDSEMNVPPQGDIGVFLYEHTTTPNLCIVQLIRYGEEVGTVTGGNPDGDLPRKEARKVYDDIVANLQKPCYLLVKKPLRGSEDNRVEIVPRS